MHPSSLPNLVLKIIKWPVALLSVAALPFIVLALGDSALSGLTFDQFQWLAIGGIGYFVAWLLIFRHRFAGSYFSTFEHEFTHALFAWATLHWVTGLTVTWRDGGECRFSGSSDGNWLIAIAPYWFPTLVLPPLVLTHFLDTDHRTMLHLAMGVTIVYHLTSTWRETHRDQPDLRKTTHLFALMFLPAANLLAYGSILLLATTGPDAALAYLDDIWLRLQGFVSRAADLEALQLVPQQLSESLF